MNLGVRPSYSYQYTVINQHIKLKFLQVRCDLEVFIDTHIIQFFQLYCGLWETRTPHELNQLIYSQPRCHLRSPTQKMVFVAVFIIDLSSHRFLSATIVRIARQWNRPLLYKTLKNIAETIFLRVLPITLSPACLKIILGRRAGLEPTSRLPKNIEVSFKLTINSFLYFYFFKITYTFKLISLF